MNPSSAEHTPEKVAVGEDFVDIFHAPSEVFERRRADGFWTPLLVIAVVGTILSFAFSRILGPVMDADSRRATRAMLEQNPGMDVSGAQGAMDAFATFLAFTGGFFEAVMIVIIGVALWVGSKIAGSDMSARSGIVVATYASIPGLVEILFAILEGLARGPSKLQSLKQLAWSPERFLDPDSAFPLLSFLAGRLDLFVMWWLFLMVLGLAIVGRMPRARAAAVVVGIWVLVSLPGLIGALTS